MKIKKENYVIIALAIILLAIVFTIAVLSFFANQTPRQNPSTTSPTRVPAPTRIAPPLPSETPDTTGKLTYDKTAGDKLLDLVENKQTLSDTDIEAKQKALSFLSPGKTYGYVYESSNIRIEYVESADLFVVEIATINVGQAKSETDVWFRARGFSEDGICKLPVMFYLNTEVNNQLWDTPIKFSPLPTGC